MNIGTTFVTDLRGKREGWNDAAVEPFDWATEAGEVSLRLSALDFDKFGYLLREIEVRGDRTIARADLAAFIGRATYLTEALRLLEWDDAFGGLARSEPGEMDAAAKEYFELVVRTPAIVTLRRIAAGRQREPVAFHLTERLLARLVDDLHALCAGNAPPASLRPM